MRILKSKDIHGKLFSFKNISIKRYINSDFWDLFILVILLLSLFVKLIKFLPSILNFSLDWFGYSEFLINYEGGFVRRGFLGQLLYYSCDTLNIDPSSFIIIISVVSFFLVFSYFYLIFKKSDYCWWILFSPLFCASTLDIIRKDYLLYLILIGTLYLLKKENLNFLLIFGITLLTVLGLLIHESFVFWGCPVVLFLIITSHSKNFYKYISITIILGVFLFVFYYHGTQDSVIRIVNSWNLILDNPLDVNARNSISALSWKTYDTLIFHLKTNFYTREFGWYTIIIRFIWGLIIFYLFSNFIFVFENKNKINFQYKNLLSCIYLFLSVCLSPMFIALSCDWARLYQYCIITTFATFLIIPYDRILKYIPICYYKVVDKFNSYLIKLNYPTKGIMIILLMIISVSQTGFDINSMFKQSPLGSICSIIEILVYPSRI